MTAGGRMLLEARGLGFSFVADRPLLNGIDFELGAGEVVALLGPNGAGKSTLLRILAGLLSGGAVVGSVHCDGETLSGLSALERAQRVAYLGPDLRAEFPVTAGEAVMMGRGCHQSGFLRKFSREDRERIEWAMRECRCWELRDRELATLSGGERQLVALARALAQGALALLLDETLSRMDLNHQALMGKLLRGLVKERGMGVVLVAHDVNLAAEWADRAYLMRQGRVHAVGGVREVLTSENLRALYPGAELVVRANPVTGAPQVFFS